MDVARWCESSPGLQWCEHWRRRIVLPLVDHHGQARSLLGRGHKAKVKTLVPTGYSAQGLALASPAMSAALRTGASMGEVWITEGEIDFMTALRFRDYVLGIRSGSWNERWSRALAGASVVVATDPDAQGDRYAAEIGMGRRWRKDVDLNDWVSREGGL